MGPSANRSSRRLLVWTAQHPVLDALAFGASTGFLIGYLQGLMNGLVRGIIVGLAVGSFSFVVRITGSRARIGSLAKLWLLLLPILVLLVVGIYNLQ